MKLVIAGSRTLNVTAGFIAELINTYNLNPTEIISGGAKGIDRCAETFAEQWNQLNSPPAGGVAGHWRDKRVKLTVIYPDWAEHGKAAGPIRNKEMAELGDALLLIWDGESKGSCNMKEQMVKLNKPVHEVIIKGVPSVQKTFLG